MSIDNIQEIYESLRRLLDTAFDEKFKSEIRTTIPGHIVEFDPETQLATIQVGIQRQDIHGKTYDPKPLLQCPVCVYGGAGGVVELKISEGDECLVHFSMRCIDGWLQQGGIAPLVRLERFRAVDAFAVLAPRSSKNAIVNYDNDGIKIRSLDGSRYIWLKDDGTIEVVSTGSTFVNGAEITSGGNVITAGGTDLDAFKAAYDAHVHGGVQSGGSTTTGPQ